MRTSIASFSLAAAACAALAGITFAQVEASSTTYFLDVDPARYAGPASQRVSIRVDDEPRHVKLSPQDEICLQLHRSASDSKVISARVRALRPEPHDPVEVPLIGPDISPGTFRSTPWGMLLRVVPPKAPVADTIEAVGTTDAPVCTI
jgi:hypothetical protein